MVVQLSLALTQAQLDIIRHHGEQSYPEECCGVLLGAAGSTQVVTSVQALPNAWTETAMAELMPFAAMAQTDGLRPTKGERYWIDPADFLAVMRSARAQSLEIIGIDHSHPDHPAVASETDGLRPAGGHRQLA